MTWRAVALIVAGGVLFALADLTRTGWIQLADALIWAVVVLSLALPSLSVTGLQVSYRLTHRSGARPGPVQGEEAKFVIELRNPWPWPRFGLVVRGQMLVAGRPHQDLKIYVPFVAPRGRVIVEAPVALARRGLHAVPDVSIETNAPFGVFRRRRRVAHDAALLVYPAPHELRPREAQQVTAGPVSRQTPARWSEEMSGSRPYVPGDLARDIHWRNFARTGRLMTRSYVTTASRRPVLTVSAAVDDALVLDDLMRLAAGAADRWAQQGDPVMFQDGVQTLELDRPALMRRLALASGDTIAPLAEALNTASPDAAVIVVVWSGDKSGLASLSDAARRFGNLTVLLLEAADAPTEAADASIARTGASISRFSHPLPSPRVETRAEERQRAAA